MFQILLLLLWSECSSCVGTHFQDWYSNAWSEDFERSMPLTRHLEMDNCWSNPAPAWSGVPKQVLCKKLLLRRFGRGNISQWWSEGLFEDFQSNLEEREEISPWKGKVFGFYFESSQFWYFVLLYFNTYSPYESVKDETNL